MNQFLIFGGALLCIMAAAWAVARALDQYYEDGDGEDDDDDLPPPSHLNGSAL